MLVLRRGAIALVLHFERNRDDFSASLIRVAKHVVALTASPRVVVLLKICPRKRRRADAVELGFAVLLKSFANHLGRQPRLYVAQALDRVVAILNLRLVFVFKRLLGELFAERRAVWVVGRAHGTSDDRRGSVIG